MSTILLLDKFSLSVKDQMGQMSETLQAIWVKELVVMARNLEYDLEEILKLFKESYNS